VRPAPTSDERAQPDAQCDRRTLRPRHADAFREHVITAALDALQDLEIDGAHDLRSNQAPRIGCGQLRRRAIVVAAGALALEPQQRSDTCRHPTGLQIAF